MGRTSFGHVLFLLAVWVVALGIACGGETTDGDADADGDSDADGDADGDHDGDDADADQDTDNPPFEPDGYCPGSAGCPDEGDGVLQVGAGMVDVTPVIDATTEIQTVDTDGDGEYEPDDGDEFDDIDEDGEFDGIWMAGFGNPRPARGVHDQQWVRAIALDSNRTTIVLVAVDCVGFFHEDADRVRALVSDLEIDYVSITATHSHEARDTMGNWGLNAGSTGIDPDYMDVLRAAAAEAIREAVSTLRPANVQYASFQLRDLPGGMLRYVSDVRDPCIIDDEVRLLRFLEAGTDTTVATLINWGAHAEYTGDTNQLLSSDIAHFIRQGIEDGVEGSPGGPTPGVGGMAVFVPGALGSQVGPGDVQARTWDGRDLGDEHSFELAETVGTQIAYYALAVLRPDGVWDMDETAPIGFRYHDFFMTIENYEFHHAFTAGIFPTREAYNWDPSLPIRPGNLPELRTQIAVIDIGRATILTVPGELDPALFIGGYDGSFTPEGVEIVDLTRENPPELERAPGPPYLRDLARDDADYVFLFGLSNDEIGYFVPEFDYELHPTMPYLDEADGDHYEETMSPGPSAWPLVEQKMRSLLEWTP